MEENTTAKTNDNNTVTEGHAIAAPKLKMPLFIGCANKEQVDAIIPVIDTEKFEIAMLSPEILKASTQSWAYSMLSVEEQKSHDTKQKNEKFRAEALLYANELKDYYHKNPSDELFNQLNALATKEGDNKAEYERLSKQYTMEMDLFNIVELRFYFKHLRSVLSDGKLNNANLSMKDTENVLDLMLSFGYITQYDVGIAKHKIRYAVTIDHDSRLIHLQNVSDILERKKLELFGDIDDVLGEMERIRAAAQLETESVVEEETDADAEPPTATDALNDK